MKTQLSRFLATALIALTAAGPAFAQFAGKQQEKRHNQLSTAVADISGKGNTAGKKQILWPQPSRKSAKGLRNAATSAPKPVAAPAAAPSSGQLNIPDLYGSVIYSDLTNAGNAEVGLYDLPKSGTADGTCLISGAKASGGGVYVDGTYYCTSYLSMFGFTLVTVTAYDLDFAEQLYSFSSMDLQSIFIGQVYDKSTDTIYGIGLTSDGNNYQLAKAVYNESSVSVTSIGILDGRWNSLMIDGSGQLWGISYELTQNGDDSEVTSSTLCKIDKETTEVTVVGETGMSPQYRSSGVIDTRSGRMLWNVCPPDGSGWMCEVDMTTGAATRLYRFKENEEVVGMFIPTAGVANDAPGECSGVKVEFPGSQLTGKVTLTTPTSFFGGSAGSGPLTVTVTANGEQVAEKAAGWGENLTFDLDMTSQGVGLYNFSVCAVNGTGAGPNTKIEGVWLGADTPEATTATLVYENGAMQLSWLPVTSTVNGGYMNLDNLTYTVRNRDGNVMASNLTTTNFQEPITEPAAITCYSYTVEAVCDGLISAPAKSNIIALGDIIPPYTSNYELDGISGWTVLDANNDGRTWEVFDNSVRAQYSVTRAMDDWLFTPAICLEANTIYTLSFNTWSSTVWNERLEVKFGDAPTVEGMKESVLPVTDVSVDDTDPISVVKELRVEQDGIYYLGFHGLSEADKFFLYISNINIAGGVSADAPEAVTGLSATPDYTGQYRATISFTTPSKTINGAPTTLTKVTVERDGTEVKVFDNPEINSRLEFTDILAANRDVTYTVAAYNEAGRGAPAFVSTHVGCDTPGAPRQLKISRTANPGEVALNWDAVQWDVNGMQFPAGSVKYTVAIQGDNGWETLAEDIESTSYSFQAVDDDSQKFVQCAVYAVADTGTSEGAVSDMIAVGKAYDGLDEPFSPTGLKYIWGISSLGDMTISVNDVNSVEGIDGVDDDGGYVMFEASEINASAMLYSGLVSIADISAPGLTFYVYNFFDENGTPNINQINVKVKYGNYPGWDNLASMTVENTGGTRLGWHKVTVPLTQLPTDELQIGIECVSKYYAFILIDNIKIESVAEHDLRAAGIDAPRKVKCGEEYTVDVTVANDGAAEAEGATVTLYADGAKVGTDNVPTLTSGSSCPVTFKLTMPKIATDPVTLFAEVTYSKDSDNANNRTYDVSVKPVQSALPAPQNAEAVNSEGNVKISWENPVPGPKPGDAVTYDFEDADSFSNQYGDWIFYDVDNSPVGGVQGTEIPGIVPGATTGSFWIWDSDDIIGNETFFAHSGTKYLFSLFRYDAGQADDWAVSPELIGKAQTINFFAKSYNPSYPETIEVYYSTGSTDIADFVLVAGSRKQLTDSDWKRIRVKLPEGAKRFAIRSCATDAFMLMIDDVTFIPADVKQLTLEGFNVYRDGVKINSEPVTGNEFIDTNLTDGRTYTYVVTAIYKEDGESGASNKAVILFNASSIADIAGGETTVLTEPGRIIVLNAEGKDLLISTADGKVIFSGTGSDRTSVSAAPGLHIVKAGTRTAKVIVR